jgi:hypothetical protein
MYDLARKFAVFAVVSALLTQVAYAQGLPDMQELPASGRQKAAEELKKAQEKAADEVYEAMVKRVKPPKTPDKKFDPWGGLRAPHWSAMPVLRLPPLWLQRLAYSNAMRMLGAFLAVVIVAVLAVLAWLWVFGA